MINTKEHSWFQVGDLVRLHTVFSDKPDDFAVGIISDVKWIEVWKRHQFKVRWTKPETFAKSLSQNERYFEFYELIHLD